MAPHPVARFMKPHGSIVMSKFIPALLAAATIGLGSAAYAQTGAAPSPTPKAESVQPKASPSDSGTRGGATKVMTEAELRQELQRQGYSNVSDVRKKGDGFEAKAMKDGKRVSLDVDAKTGKVVTR
jgi:Peptidase propeptide and YPEB domain